MGQGAGPRLSDEDLALIVAMAREVDPASAQKAQGFVDEVRYLRETVDDLVAALVDLTTEAQSAADYITRYHDAVAALIERLPKKAAT